MLNISRKFIFRSSSAILPNHIIINTIATNPDIECANEFTFLQYNRKCIEELIAFILWTGMMHFADFGIGIGCGSGELFLSIEWNWFEHHQNNRGTICFPLDRSFIELVVYGWLYWAAAQIYIDATSMYESWVFYIQTHQVRYMHLHTHHEPAIKAEQSRWWIEKPHVM